MFRKVALLIIAVSVCMGLSACGKTGELYLPNDKIENSSPSSSK